MSGTTRATRPSPPLALAAILAGILGAIVACNVNPGDPTGDESGTGGAGATNVGVTSVGDASGISRTLTLGELTSSQIAVLCDWAQAKEGGYGRAVTCGFGATASTADTTTDCVTALAQLGYQCPSLTVANDEDCVNATGPDLCKVQVSPACALINACKSGQ